MTARGGQPGHRRRRAPGNSFAPAFAAALAAHAALIGGACSAGTGAAPQAPPEFSAERAWADLERLVAFGPRPAGSQALREARAWLAAELAALGLAVAREPFRAETPAGPVDFENLFADLAGRSVPDGARPPLVILASHVDTKRASFAFVGANDGGSSTAVLLELARALASASAPRRVDYRFLFLDGEEAVRETWIDPDNRYGSRHHAARLVESGEIARVGACVLLDMVGDRDLALWRESYSTPALVSLFVASAERQGLARHFRGPRQEAKDDHLSFLAENVPSVDLIDLDYGPANSWWHTAEDTLDKCSAESLGVAGRIVLGGLAELEEYVLARAGAH
jgi:hypothetical protein